MKLRPILILSATLSFVAGLRAESVTTDPVGAMAITLPAQSDTTLSLPLHRPAVFRGSVAAVNLAQNTVTFQRESEWQINQFADSQQPHYLLLDGGADEGMTVTILSNTADTVTVELGAGDTLANTQVGDPVSIVPYWTVGTLFADGVPDGTTIYLYDSNVPGVNLASSRALLYYGGNWYDSQSFSNANSTIVFPQESVIARNSSADPINLVLAGAVPMTKSRTVLRTLQPNVPQDSRVGYASPVEVTLREAGFNAKDGDSLFYFDPAVPGYNKAGSQAFLYFGGAWYDASNFADVTDSFKLTPGLGYVYRKAQTGIPETLVWQSLPPYLANE